VNRLIRRTLGAIAALVGAAGAIFSGAAVFGSWELADRLGREIPAAVADLERVVASVQRQGDATLGLIDAARDRVRFVGETVEELAGPAGEGGRSDPSPILEAIDPEIERRLESAETFIVAMQESLLSLNRALVMLDALPLLSRRGSPGDRPFGSVAASLAEAAELLDEAMLTLERIRSGQALSARQLDQFRELLDEVDLALGDVRGQIDLFFDSLDQAGARLSRVRSASTTWIGRGAVASSCFFLCFGASQLSLMAHGLALLLARGSSPPIGWRSGPAAGIVADDAPPSPGGDDDQPRREADRCAPPSPDPSSP
jgi:hypothetical protein